MNLFIAMIDDPHTDTEPFPFTTPEAAIAFARKEATDLAGDRGIDESYQPEGWLYHATYGEGGGVWVIEKELDGA